MAPSAYQKAGESRVVLDTPFDRQQRCRTAKNEYETADSAYLIYLPYTDILRPDHPSYLNVSAMSRKSITLTSVLSVVLIAVVATAFIIQREAAHAAPQNAEADGLTLITATPEEGFALAVTLSRKGVTTTQTDREVLHALRPDYAHNSDALIAASQVIAIHYQTIAAANNYWRD